MNKSSHCQYYFEGQRQCINNKEAIKNLPYSDETKAMYNNFIHEINYLADESQIVGISLSMKNENLVNYKNKIKS